MLKVAQYEVIRRKVLCEGQSQREVARFLGVSRKTVTKALANPIPPGYRLSEPRANRVMEGFRGVIESILASDAALGRPKQRHTSRRIFERLRSEHGFKGAECTVRRFVQKLSPKIPEVYVPLLFSPGEEGQVDWGKAWVKLNGKEVQVHLFCLRLCHSRASIVIPYTDECMESFLDGHVRAFEYFGGIPRRLAYDNLRSAVKGLYPGRKRDLNERFRELQSWYLFESRFCNVESGNEKGHVENLVKRSQLHYLTPMPEVTSLAELASHLKRCCQEDLESHQTAQSRRGLMAEDQAAMIELPGGRFPACREEQRKITKESTVRFEDNNYSVPVAYAGQECLLRGYVDRVTIHVGVLKVAEHQRSRGEGEWILDPLHYLPTLERKPGLLENGRPFVSYDWAPELVSMRRELERRMGAHGSRQYIGILMLLRTHSMTALIKAVGTCLAKGAVSLDAVNQVLRPGEIRASGVLDLCGRPELSGVGLSQRSTSLYDQLRMGVGQ